MLSLLMKKKRAESWYNSFLVNRGQISWQELIQEIVERFEVRNVVGVVDEFNHLRQRGSLEEYKSQLEEFIEIEKATSRLYI